MKNNEIKPESLNKKNIGAGFLTTPKIIKDKKVKTKEELGIPKEVANRMGRRIAFTTGIPTISGMGVFIISYYVITKGIADIPPVVTLILSGSCFLVGLIGLSYGILSASWDKNTGSFLGLENIRPNLKRMRDAFNTKEIIK